MKLILLFIFSLNIFAQNQKNSQEELIRKQLEEFMQQRDEMMKSLFNDESFSQMEKRMEEMMKRFNGMDNLDFNSESIFGGGFVGQYDWKEDDKFKTLSLKVKQLKDQPLDIKIEKGQIKIKGDVEQSDKNGNFDKNRNKQITKIHFERIFSIPSGVDDKNPEFENKEGELLIKFKKLKAGLPKAIKNEETNEKLEERIPISPDDKDIKL